MRGYGENEKEERFHQIDTQLNQYGYLRRKGIANSGHI